jgi:hypothetical protein
LTQSVAWNRVVSVEQDGNIQTGDDFKQLLLGDVLPTSRERVDVDLPSTPPVRLETPPQVVIIDSARRSRQETEVRKATVRSIAFDARAANWDADVEVDGLIIDLYPLDEMGTLVPARGTVEFTLFVERTGVIRYQRAFLREPRWVVSFAYEDIGPSGARFRLPFRQFYPETEPDLAPYGAVHARVTIPGQGVFDATETVVRIRPYSAIRDRLEQNTGSRFFAIERTRGSGP